MKKAFTLILLTVLTVSFSVFFAQGESAAANDEWKQGDEPSWSYSDGNISYWIENQFGNLVLYGRNEDLSPENVMIAPVTPASDRIVSFEDAPHVSKLRMVAGRLVLQLNEGGAEDMVCLGKWEKEEEAASFRTQYVTHSNTLMDRIITVGNYQNGKSYLTCTEKTGISLWMAKEENFDTVSSKKYDSVHVHPLGFFIFSNAKGGYALYSPQSQEEDVLDIGDLKKGTTPISGVSYLACVLKNGDMVYTRDGLNIHTFPQELSEVSGVNLEFWNNRIVLQYSVFLAQVIPGVGDEFFSMSQAEYSQLHSSDMITVIKQ